MKFLLGAICGGIIGGGAVLLLAPGSGDETLAALKEKLAALEFELKSAINQKRIELEAELENYKKLN